MSLARWPQPEWQWNTYSAPTDTTKSFTVGLLMDMLRDAIERARRIPEAELTEEALLQFILTHHLQHVKL